MRRVLFACLLALPGAAAAQAPAAPAPPPRDTTPPGAVFGVTEYQLARQKLEQVMQKDGFSVYIIGDMEGLAGVVRNGTEMRPGYRGGNEAEHQRFRDELTAEVNAVIAGARAAGATQFIVNEGHGGTLFRNIVVEDLDPDAILIRGYPKPIVMSTGLNPMVDAIMIVGAHSNAGTPGVISHSFAFDSFTVNGTVLNEAGIAAFIGGEMSVPMILASGDDVLVTETVQMLGPIETVTTKVAFSRSAAAGKSFPQVHRELQSASATAVKKAKAGQYKPLVLQKPYKVRFCLRRNYAEDEWVRTAIGTFDGVTADGSQGCFAYTTESAEAVGNLLNLVEWTVLKP